MTDGVNAVLGGKGRKFSPNWNAFFKRARSQSLKNFQGFTFGRIGHGLCRASDELVLFKLIDGLSFSNPGALHLFEFESIHRT